VEKPDKRNSPPQPLHVSIFFRFTFSGYEAGTINNGIKDESSYKFALYHFESFSLRISTAFG
jgi:hypothetical protein